MDGEAIGRIDGLVFDRSCCSKIRAEALRFMMEHTEGFEFLLVESCEKVSSDKSGSKRRKSSSNLGAKSPANLESRRNVLLALETITEFMDDVYQQHFDRDESHAESRDIDDAWLGIMAELIVDAFRSLPETISFLLTEWDAMVSLLLKESDVFASGYALQEFNSLALLHVMLKSANCINDQLEVSGPTGAWHQLGITLRENLLRLFIRFQDNEKISFILVSFLEYVDMSKGGKVLNSFLKATSDMLSRCRHEGLSYQIVSAWSRWIGKAAAEDAGGGTVGRAINDVVREVSESLQSTIAEGRGELQVSSEISFSSSGNRKRKKSSSSAENVYDVLLSVSLAADKLAVLLKSHDCRGSSDSEVGSHWFFTYFEINPNWLYVTQLLDHLHAVANMSVDILTDDTKSRGVEAPSVASLLCVMRCVYGLMLWAAKDHSLTTQHEESLSKLEQNREVLIDIIQKCLDVGKYEHISVDNTLRPKISSLRREAFAMIGDMRMLFFSKSAHSYWTASQEMMQAMREVFDHEVELLMEELSSSEGSSLQDRSSRECTSRLLINSLLYPLEAVLVFDIDNLNRRQGAAVLNFLSGDNENIIEVVKLWCKKLKDADMIKYLEVQMVALKGMFNDKILPYVSQLRDADRLESQSNYSTGDIEDFEENVEAGSSALQQFSQRMSHTFGVGKLKGEAAVALVLFFKAGIDYALSDVCKMSFFSSLDYYIRFLSSAYVSEISSYLEAIVMSPSLPEDIVDLLELNPMDAPGQRWSNMGIKAYYAFSGSLSKKGTGRAHNLDVSDITRDTNRTGRSIATSRPFKSSHRVGRVSAESESHQSVDSSASSAVATGLHSHVKEYGSKRRRASSISSTSSGSVLDDMFSGQQERANVSFGNISKRKYGVLSEEESDTKAGHRKASSDSRNKRSRLFDDGKRRLKTLEEHELSQGKVSTGSHGSKKGKRSTRSRASSRSFSATESEEGKFVDDDRSDSQSEENEVAFGLHIEDLDETQRSSPRKVGRRSSLSRSSLSRGEQTVQSTSDLFDDLEAEDIVSLPPSRRNRNR